jgi:mRNA interferase MazF
MSSSNRRLARGDIVIVRLPLHQPPGREQEGARPAVVGLPGMIGPTRFPTVVLSPLTTDRGQPWAVQSPDLYPRLVAGAAGLPRASLMLLDQTRALGMARLVSYLGSLSSGEFAPIQAGLRRIFAM